MRWALRSTGLLIAILTAGFVALAFEFDPARQWIAVFLASLAAMVAVDRAPASSTADEHHV